jgi:hypothetical protein
MPGKYKSLYEVINNEAEFDTIRKKAKEYEIIEKFKEIFPELKKIVEAKRIEKGKLFLRVENSVWRSELNFKQELMITKINKYFNEEVINRIKFI